MRTVLFLATLTLAAAAVHAQQPAPTPARPGAGEQKPAAGEEAPPPDQKVGEAPTVPTGQTATEAALLAFWRMGYFNDVKLDVSRAKPPLTGYVLTVLDSEKPAVRELKMEGNEELSKDDF